MNHDPLEALEQFYDACRIAPVPQPTGNRRRFAVPLIGALAGFTVAVLLSIAPVGPDASACVRAVNALANRQVRRVEPSEPPTHHASVRVKDRWSA